MPQLARLDKILVDRGLARSREEARSLIEGGSVSVGGIVREKAAAMISQDADVRVETSGPKYVSRGAHKLIRALDVFGASPSGLDCADIGASTGGFTQVLLERGASRVAAVDVGYGQLAWELRTDPRVRAVERMNARYVSVDDIGWLCGFITIDASFISLRVLLPNVEALLAEGGTMIALVKPQFEVGRGRAKKGVVRDPSEHARAMSEVAEFVSEKTRLGVFGATWSPIKGPEGNIEFLFMMSERAGREVPEIDFASLASEAADALARCG